MSSSTTNCKKAIIAVAGFGTRRLPITKSLEKCMLPVGDRPIIDYVVEDCLKAGIEEFIFIVGEDFDQLKRYYGHNMLLETYLEDKGKTAELREVQALAEKARFRYVIQDQHQPYGTSVPIWLARYLMHPDEKVLVVFGDQFIYREDGQSEIASFISRASQSDTPAAMLAVEVPWEDVSHYGIVSTKQQGNLELYESIIEKPSRDQAPSNLNNASCFIFDHSIFPFLEQNVNAELTGEHMITDAINAYVKAGNQMA
ncbi:MAG TPA: sugar phosphate nucleotidyltransferase, partial [Candidatus Saccharimonadales bacterium]